MKHWKVGIIKDTSKPDLGLHGLHTAFLGLPGVEIAALADSNPRMCEDIMKFTQAERRYYDPAEMIEREKPDIVIITSRRPSADPHGGGARVPYLLRETGVRKSGGGG